MRDLSAPFSARRLDPAAAFLPEPPTIRLRTLIWIRWFALAGQSAALLLAALVLDLTFDLTAPLAVVAVTALANGVLTASLPPTHRLSNDRALMHLMADQAQLMILLGLTGGIANPFSMLLCVPATVAALILPRRLTRGMVAFTLGGGAVLAVWHRPLPWSEPILALPDLYIFGLWAATAVTVTFLALYVGTATAEARRRDRALATLERSLAAERELSALGGLAAAAAHELGTPLGTIKLAARDLLRELPEDHPLREDADLIDTQAARCRDILQRLADAGRMRQGHFDEASLEALLREVSAPFAETGVELVIEAAGDRPDPAPRLPRRPEILQALTNFIENAVDFARHEVIIRFGWTQDRILVDILDDGPGFDPSILSRLGEPYLSSRRQGSIDRAEAQGAGGLGLGIFIAKTLLERTGAHVRFVNGDKAGAKVAISWPRSAF